MAIKVCMDLENLQQKVKTKQQGLEKDNTHKKTTSWTIIFFVDNHKTHMVHLEEPCLQKPLFQRGYNLHLTKDAFHHLDKTLPIGYLQESQLVVRNVVKPFKASKIDVHLRLLLWTSSTIKPLQHRHIWHAHNHGCHGLDGSLLY